MLKTHPAFTTESKLEELASKYNVKIFFLPKFHCEMSPIEGLWANQKTYVRKRNDQNFKNFQKHIMDHRELVRSSNLNAKLWRRFRHTIHAYKLGKTSGEIMKLYFGSKCKANIAEHRKIHDTFKN